jgi:hypothetical protein
MADSYRFSRGLRLAVMYSHGGQLLHENGQKQAPGTAQRPQKPSGRYVPPSRAYRQKPKTATFCRASPFFGVLRAQNIDLQSKLKTCMGLDIVPPSGYIRFHMGGLCHLTPGTSRSRLDGYLMFDMRRR